MSFYRRMRLLLMFDLPSVESYEKQEYTQFKKILLKNGYTMIQFSVYMKPTNAQIRIEYEVAKLKKSVPRNGNIRLIQITEKQYQNMVMILGHKKSNEIYNNTERYVKI